MSRKTEFVRFVEHMVTGGAQFWTGYGAFAICDKFLGLNLWWSKLAANVTGVLINFLLERTWVFGDTAGRSLTNLTSRYVSVTLLNFGIDYGIVRLLKDVGISPYIGQFVSAAFFTGWNYLWFKFWVFSKADGRQQVREVAAHVERSGRQEAVSPERG